MDERTLRAIGAIHGLIRALEEFDPDGSIAPLARLQITTTGDDGILWDPQLSEEGVVRLTALLRAAAPKPSPARPVRHLRLVGEAS
jgi:hypothetical protein